MTVVLAEGRAYYNMLLTEYLNTDIDFGKYGVFEPVIDRDSHFFINLQRLRHTEVPEFRDSLQLINAHFEKIIKLLLQAKAKDCKRDNFYKNTFRYFKFNEVNGICLGFSKSVSGAGFGPKLSAEVVSTAFDIVKAGIEDPEFFQLMPLFQENVGPDRLSDMIATILLERIKAYTLRINAELGIVQKHFPNHQFKNGFLINKFKGCELLLLPRDILHKLPIAECWEDIDTVICENQAIRNELNEEVLDGWAKYSASVKKSYLRRLIFQEPDRFKRVINAYKEEVLDEVNISDDGDYYIDVVSNEFNKNDINWVSSIAAPKNSLMSSREFLEIFQDWVENNKGWEVIQGFKSHKKEKGIQSLIHLSCKNYIKTNNLDASFEVNMGRGPADIKFSRGNDKTIIEVKLSSNPQYMHGYKTQIEEYANAEGTKNRIYVLIDVGNPGRVNKLEELHEDDLFMGKDVPDLVIIDANPKDSASTFFLDDFKF